MVRWVCQPTIQNLGNKGNVGSGGGADECLVKASGTWSGAKLSVDDIDDLEVVRRVMAKVAEFPCDESGSRYGLEYTMWAYDQVTNE